MKYEINLILTGQISFIGSDQARVALMTYDHEVRDQFDLDRSDEFDWNDTNLYGFVLSFGIQAFV